MRYYQWDIPWAICVDRQKRSRKKYELQKVSLKKSPIHNLIKYQSCYRRVASGKEF